MSKIEANLPKLSGPVATALEKSINSSEDASTSFASITVPGDFSQAALFASCVTKLSDCCTTLSSDSVWLGKAVDTCNSFCNESINDVSNSEVPDISIKDFKINKL